MSLFTLIAVIVVVGVILYLVNKFIPMEPTVKQILNAVVIIVLVIWLLFLFLPGIGDIRVPTAN